jgi:hypothetical protein
MNFAYVSVNEGLECITKELRIKEWMQSDDDGSSV